MSDLIRELFSSEVYLPRGHCYLWKPPLVALQIAGNTLAGAGCLAVVAALVYRAWRRARRRADGDGPAPGGAPVGAGPGGTAIVPLALFMAAAGLMHLAEGWAIWRALHWVDGALRALAGAAAIWMALALIRGASRLEKAQRPPAAPS